MRISRLLTVLTVCLAVTAVHAQDNRPLLTSGTLDRYLKILPDLAAMAKADANTFDMRNMDAIKGSQLEGKFAQYLQKNGWKMEEFVWISHKISSGIGYLMAKPEMEKLRAELMAQKQEIMSDPDMPEATKQQMLAMMDQQSGGPGALMARLDAVTKELTPSELKLLEANKERIITVYRGIGE
ncbi:MAG: hypothetical protein QNJ22_22305 [Desulfosarcinaceae bacterium]|nr:hypothetical protein [Desulfosarcinaceae bacterium]